VGSCSSLPCPRAKSRQMMDAQRSRLAALAQPWCETKLVSDLLGIDIDVVADPQLLSAFRAWSDRFLGHDPVRNNGSGSQVDRHALETFLLQTDLSSWKWAAVYLGMRTDTMKTVVDRLEGQSVATQVPSTVSRQLVQQRGAALLFKAFPSLRSKVFKDHSQMCRALHEAIHAELGIEVAPVLCVTSEILDAPSPDIAAAFDAITGEAVGLRYQVWLETRKPVNIRPDVCSLRFYAHNEADLRDQVMKGSEPAAIDARLRAA
jgi:hypothetical protein